MKTIALNGSNGFLGQQICKYFDNKYNFIKINRTDYYSEPGILAEKLNGADIIVNLAGEPISLILLNGKKNRIISSRVKTTRNLMKSVILMKRKPELVISMSAIGIYDYENIHDEFSKNYGNDFLSHVCKDWENEVTLLDDIPYSVIRCGIVLSKNNGLLKKIMFPFRLGLGAVIGDGSQPMSFIHIHDFLRAFDFVIDHHLTGIINFVAPNYCTNLEFSRVLCRTMKRPLLFKVPAGLVKMITGESSSMLLNGQKVIPRILFEHGFTFKHTGIGSAIRNIIRFT